MATPPPGDRAGEQAHGWKYEQRITGPSGPVIYASSNIHIFSIGEFDPGSERTLAACLTHASRARTEQS